MVVETMEKEHLSIYAARSRQDLCAKLFAGSAE